MTEQVNHPSHYGGDNTYEVIKVIEAWELDFVLGNAVKYIARAGKKTRQPLVDLKKAIWYLERKILQLEQADAKKIQSRPLHKPRPVAAAGDSEQQGMQVLADEVVRNQGHPVDGVEE